MGSFRQWQLFFIRNHGVAFKWRKLQNIPSGKRDERCWACAVATFSLNQHGANFETDNDRRRWKQFTTETFHQENLKPHFKNNFSSSSIVVLFTRISQFIHSKLHITRWCCVSCSISYDDDVSWKGIVKEDRKRSAFRALDVKRFYWFPSTWNSFNLNCLYISAPVLHNLPLSASAFYSAPGIWSSNIMIILCAIISYSSSSLLLIAGAIMKRRFTYASASPFKIIIIAIIFIPSFLRQQRKRWRMCGGWCSKWEENLNFDEPVRWWKV
jgi:hypothetical protein